MAAGIGVASSVSAVPGLAANRVADLGVNEIYARARGGIGGEPGMWWYSGRLWGKLINDKAVNFFAVEGFSFNRMERQADGELRQVMEECGFWKDPQTQRLLDDWTNPLNGLACKVGHFRSRQDLKFSAEGKIIDAGPFEGHISDPVTSGPILWISESLLGAFPATRDPEQDPLTYGGPTRSMLSLATFTSDADTILARRPKFVPGTLHFQSSSGWYPWMRMRSGSRPDFVRAFRTEVAVVGGDPCRAPANPRRSPPWFLRKSQSLGRRAPSLGQSVRCLDLGGKFSPIRD